MLKQIKQEKKFQGGAYTEFENLTLADVSRFLGKITLTSSFESIPKCGSKLHTKILDDLIPESYDARSLFPSCFKPSFASGKCSSSYATATASMLANRLCMKSPDSFQELQFSPQSILSCSDMSQGCHLGSPDAALFYALKKGLKTLKCFPYVASDAPLCEAQCADEEPIGIQSMCRPETGAGIKQEIMSDGPVTAVMFLYHDFLLYKGGVYTPSRLSNALSRKGQRLMHVVVILGWGYDWKSKQPYWIIQNHFGPHWGEDGGFAKISQ